MRTIPCVIADGREACATSTMATLMPILGMQSGMLLMAAMAEQMQAAVMPGVGMAEGTAAEMVEGIRRP